MQEIHTLAQRVYGGLVVQLKAQPGQVFMDDGQGLPQGFPVWMYQDEVILITDIMPDV